MIRDMTNALYSRIEAIEMFAADVAHELKNPLTSLRSAVETLPLARNENSRARLLAVIEHDVDVIAPPDIDITGGQESGDVAFDAVVEVRPTVAVPGYGGLQVTIDRPAVD